MNVPFDKKDDSWSTITHSSLSPSSAMPSADASTYSSVSHKLLHFFHTCVLQGPQIWRERGRSTETRSLWERPSRGAWRLSKRTKVRDFQTVNKNPGNCLHFQTASVLYSLSERGASLLNSIWTLQRCWLLSSCIFKLDYCNGECHLGNNL